MDFDPSVFWHYLFFGPIIDGAKITVYLAVISQVTGIALGLFAALGRLSRHAALRWFTALYLWLFRGTPLLVQLVFFYFAVPHSPATTSFSVR